MLQQRLEDVSPFEADDREVKRQVKTVDWTSLPSAALYTARAASPDGSLLDKAGRMYEFAVKGRKRSQELIQIRRERGAEITRLMGFSEETAQAIRSLDEHWDGSVAILEDLAADNKL